MGVDQTLLKAVVHGTEIGLKMTNTKLMPIGTSRIATSRHSISVMIGLVGRHSGNMALNLSEAAAVHLAGALLDRTFDTIDEDCIDAIMELGNMVGGGVKGTLHDSSFAIDKISLPSVVIGQNYAMGYSRGISVVSVEFELPQMPFSSMNARYFSTTLSLLRSSGA
jgi:CheY-specific phosphatase CheX